MDIVRAAIEWIREQRDDVVLLKAGYAEELEAPWAQNTGWIDEADMPKLYNAADVFFHPSEYESFGFPVLESMACGTPVVGSDRASVSEVASDAAVLLDPDADSPGRRYGRAILDRLDDRVDETAVRRSESFTWAETAREVLDVYDSTI
jgi:glycosyltransferase involved in cell wall biosynthesis